MNPYEAQDDPLCYPGTRVLRNKAGVKDQEILDEFEQLMFDSRAEERLPQGALDFTHYRALHRHFFQDVYDWAGEIRTIRTGKGNNWFCYPQYITTFSEQLFQELARRQYLLVSANRGEFAKNAAWLISEINAIHPFREGNGRIQLVFLTMLARNAGYGLNHRKLRPKLFLEAMIRSFGLDLTLLTEEIERLL